MTTVNSENTSVPVATLAQCAQLKAQQTPDEIAIYLEDGEHIRYGSIFEEAMSLASALKTAGLKAGDVISFQLPNWREAVAVDIAASWLGLVVNPVIPIYRDRELAFLLADCRAKCLFIPGVYRRFDFPEMIQRLKPQLPDLELVITVRGEGSDDYMVTYDRFLETGSDTPVCHEGQPDDLKMIMYTSGTTGRAKAVRHSNRSLRRAIFNGVEGWKLQRGDIMLMPSPVTHVTGFANGIELPFLCDCKSALMERWDVNLAIDYIERVNATGCVSATPFLQELVDKAREDQLALPSLRFFACGGASVPPSLIRSAYEVMENCRAFRVYGCTEAPLVTVGFIEDGEMELAATTDGRILNWEVKIVDDDGNALTQGADGEILVRGEAMMLGYGEEAQTRGSVDSEGFFHTGDIGHITAEGAIVITDRKKDIIIRGGENLSAREIEDVLHQHPRISEAAVVAMPHERLGEGVCAVLVLRDSEGLSLEDLKPYLAESGLAKQKWPEKVEVVTELLKTASGKVRKDVLRQQIKEQMSS